jgi:hypothetical protein
MTRKVAGHQQQTNTIGIYSTTSNNPASLLRTLPASLLTF